MISTWGHHHHHHQHPETILDDVSGSGELFREDAVQGGCCPGRMLLLTQPWRTAAPKPESAYPGRRMRGMRVRRPLHPDVGGRRACRV